jgi:alkylation response protein AidB-like acyl-CoA dehydrogenase
MTLNPEQQAIQVAVADLLAGQASSAALRAAMLAGDIDRKLWQQIADLGCCALQLSEAQGGLGMGTLELCLIAEQLGRRLAYVPWFESVVLATSLLGELGAEAEQWLPGLADGSLISTFSSDPVQALPVAGGWRLDGRIEQFQAAGSADLLLVTARLTDGELLLFALARDAQGLSISPLQLHDASRPAACVELAGLLAADCLVRGQSLEEKLARLRLTAATVLAAEQVGVAQQCLDLSLSYVSGRVQFGQPIAAFQAVKHRCAQMMVSIELARSAFYAAAARNDLQAVAAARCLANEAAQFCAQEAIQLHGGVGFCWEYDPHLYFKRAQSNSQWFGMSTRWLAQVAAELLQEALPHELPEEAFQAEVHAWLEQHLSGEFLAMRGCQGPGDDSFAPALAKRWEQCLAAGGWVGMGWPAAHGGRDLPLAQQVAFHEAYVRAGGPGRIGHIGEQLLAPTLMAYGTPAQQQRFLPGIRAGTSYWAQGYSEPDAGSDLANVKTRAKREGDQWIINGQKVWTSWAQESDWIFVLARTEAGSQRHRGLSLLLVPLRQPGITIRPIRQMTGSAEFNEVFFDSARTEASLHLGELGQGWKVAMDLLGFERGVSTLGQQAQFEHELQLLLSQARRDGLAQDPVLAQRIAAAALGLQALRANALRVLSGAAGSPESFVAKYAWSNWHRDFGRLAADVLGPQANVIDADPAAQRLRQVWLYSRADTIYAGSNEIQLNLIAERALGMPR